MSAGEKIEKALESFDYPIRHGTYRGKEKTYIIYNTEDEREQEFEDNEPKFVRFFMQIHWYVKKEEYQERMKWDLKKKLKEIAHLSEIRTVEDIDNGTWHITFRIEIDVPAKEMEA